MNKKPLYIRERPSKFDGQIKEAAESESIFVSTKKSTPSETKLATVMNKLKNKASTEPYGISNKLLKIQAPATAAPLNALIKRCFRESDSL